MLNSGTHPLQFSMGRMESCRLERTEEAQSRASWISCVWLQTVQKGAMHLIALTHQLVLCPPWVRWVPDHLEILLCP